MARSEAVGFINVTRQCNVDCKRCYLTEANRAAGERLPTYTLKAFLTSDFWADRPVTLIWEGGEPTIVGPSRMQLYVDQARGLLPHASQTMVTNCFSVPNWLIDLSHSAFNGQVETTFALGHKFSLSGSEDLYTRRFLTGLNRFWDAGVVCTVNVELNSETIKRGPTALAELMLSTKAKVWEFDISVDFRTFLAEPIYQASSAPELPLTASYAAVWTFLHTLEATHGRQLRDAGITIGALEQVAGEANNQFNVLSEDRFLTLNPDGSVTTNPLYSDLEGTFLGNLQDAPLDELLSSPRRLARVIAERRRLLPCRSCPHFSYCSGGPAHVPVTDGSGECAGGKGMWDLLLEKMRCA
ncbi:TPA: hypothetical protein ONB34_003830 [Pseudomonas aeruginosa]|uniref:Radical SAM additional 4Fe4S-binding SPASM domain-containing protein n=2 Tax=Pseudomonas TaxID=286 RepID=A0A7G8A933_PSEAI|nr:MULTISPECIES: radical SAM/SPASM domain-containing protein [Pseudomonas]ALZ46015.1 Radical SAM additional 4Fe4S-binding SPASM domain-containing protein [Pseudomonas putida]EMZ45856.1 radical SAM additional 4Fe4S-binding SPASM domain-containing protein [Pseudomonas sp. P179]MBX5679926.1 hypothetical protein [Pseudomonas aeruginosa]MBX5754257.1 hypothetical protein [Pseudomonas aeruginosa]MBX6074772.1 hypothetical protein [Pseudomonas aeruginosa]